MQDNKKTIVEIAALNPKKIGSFEELMIDLSLELKRMGIEPVVVFNEEVPLNLKSRYAGIELARLSREKGAFQFYCQLFKLIRKHKPDIVDFHFYPFFSMMTIFVSLCGVRNIIFTDRCSGEIEEKKGIKKILSLLRTKFMMRFIKKMIGVSNFVVERDKTIPGIDASKLVPVHNGINLAKFSCVRNDKEKFLKDMCNAGKDHFVVMSATNLIKEKGIEYLISAADILLKENRDMMFLIVGEGKDGDELKSKVKGLGLEDNIKFMGLRSDIDQILAVSDVFVYPSVWQEAFGFAIAEAMACGVPVISTRVGGIPEIIQDGVTGFIIPPEDHIAIAKALRELYQDSVRVEQMGKKARERVERYFNMKTRTAKVIGIYKEFL